MHEQSLDNNLAMSESIVHKVHQNSSHTLKSTTIVDIKSLTTNDNQSNVFNNNNKINSTLLTRTVENCERAKKYSDFITSSRHVFEASTTETVVLRQRTEDTVNNNRTFVVNPKTMSHKNFMLSFDSPSSTSQAPLAVGSETILSPAEVPFGRRYAEISQFKNHPNVEWTIDDNHSPQPDYQEQLQISEEKTFFEDGENERDQKLSMMDVNHKEKSDDEELLLAKEFFESAAESSSDGVLAEGEDETSSESEMSGSPGPQLEISLMERLLRTHPVWFLPSLQRGGSVHLLQGKEIGTFIVRGSSQKDTMAISVRLPLNAGPYIEHYLIQSSDGLLNLESSRFKFDSIPSLVAHYCNCCDELPVQLSLPRGLREAPNRQQLMSLALLGSEFWRCPLATPQNDDETSLSQMKSPTETSGISTMAELSSLKQKNNSILNKLNQRGNNPTQLVETPSDTASSLSSFPASGATSTLLSPQSIDNGFIASPSVEFCNLKSSSNSINNLNSPSGIIGKTSTFKVQTSLPSTSISNSPQQKALQSNFEFQQHHQHDSQSEECAPPQQKEHRTRPTPPNTLNLAIANRAPIPPKRWQKPTPTTPSPFVEQNTLQTNNNFTVTTTVTFNVAKQQQQHTSEIEIPPRNNVPIISERLSPEGGESRTNSDSSLQKWNHEIKSPLNPFKSNNESVRSKRGSSRKKESKHYQESDILESPSVYEYCRSNLGDKISDYEDLWTQENNSRSSLHIALADSNGTNSSKECEVSSPMVISPSQQLTPSQLVGSEVAITTLTTPIQHKPFFDSKKSPFYSDPVDAVVPQQTTTTVLRRENKLNHLTFHRYSEPPKGQFEDLINFHSSPFSPNNNNDSNMLQQPFIAASLDHLKSINKPHTVKNEKNDNHHRHNQTPWLVDSSWEFVDKNDESDEENTIKKRTMPQSSSLRYRNTDPNQQVQQKFNTIERTKCAMSVDSYLMNSKKSNIYKMLAKKFPDINLKSTTAVTTINHATNIPSTWQTFESDSSNRFQRLSSYDNVNAVESIYGGSEDGTLFSEPWDSSQWDSFLPTTTDESSTIHLSKCRPAISEDETIIEDSSAISKSNANTIQRNPLINSGKVATVLRHRSGCYKDREILKHPRNKVEHNNPGEGIEAYTLNLAQNESSIFAKNIHNFVACTRESKEKIPQKVMRNIRQFMNGLKNFLIKSEKDFGVEVEKARAALKPDEFLNLDQILEGVMHQLIIMPLREHLYELFVEYYGSRGDIELMIENMKYAENKDPTAFGVKRGLKTPPPHILNRISMVFAKLQEAELPFEKLDLLLNAVTLILDNTVDPDSQSSDVRHFGCDDFLPLLAYVICKCGFHFAEIEAEYMWNLLQPTLMIGQAGYYVTSLCSAAISLKEFRAGMESSEDSGSATQNIQLECSVLRIIIPDEYNGSIQTKTIPVRPGTTTKEVCKIIAHKSQITNPMDYGLFKLADGEETLLMDHDCPQEIRLASAGRHCMLAYKRFDAKIAWPKQ